MSNYISNMTEHEIAGLLNRQNYGLDIVQYISALRAENERLKNPWISVEERLPRDNEVVFVIGINESIYIGSFDSEEDQDKQFSSDEYGWVRAAYWMQIPLPPETGAQE